MARPRTGWFPPFSLCNRWFCSLLLWWNRKRLCNSCLPDLLQRMWWISSPRSGPSKIHVRNYLRGGEVKFLTRYQQVNNTWFVKFNVDDGAQDVVLWLRSQSFKVLGSETYPFNKHQQALAAGELQPQMRQKQLDERKHMINLCLLFQGKPVNAAIKSEHFLRSFFPVNQSMGFVPPGSSWPALKCFFSSQQWFRLFFRRHSRSANS